MTTETAPLPIPAPASRASAIRAQGLSRRFGRVAALQNVSFDIPAGSICGLIGPNGAGKTTLLRILAGLDEPDEGLRFIDNVDVAARRDEVRSRFGYVPDYAGLYEGLTVFEMVRFFASAQGLSRDRAEVAATRALTQAGLSAVLDRPANALSKGMSQRACVACALVHDPPVLFLDEPAAGLDPRARIELRELLKDLRRAGKTILISSHILSELSDMVDRVLILERGVVKASGAVDAAWADNAKRVEARVRIEVMGDGGPAEVLLRSLPLVQSVIREAEFLEVVLREGDGLTGGPAQVAELVKTLVEADVQVCAVIPHRPNLEALFMTVTKGELQ
ncbi:MAG: ABC transporter ATP-binding protein [Myxococcota bacterium]